MNDNDELPSVLDERRRADRVQATGRVRLNLSKFEFEGRAENASRTGLLFFSDDEVPCTVEMEEDGVVKKVEGVLVRIQRLGGDRTGWAIEFRP